MKKIIAIAAIAAMLAVSCRKIDSGSNSEGTLSFGSFELQYDTELVTRATSVASGNYSIFIYDSEGTQVRKTTYAAVKDNDSQISLPAGSYTIEARSCEEDIPASAFEQPIYGATAEFSITAGQTTVLDPMVCTLVQVKVTVSYDDAFMKSVTGDGKATVTVDPSAPLDFALSYASGSASYDKAAGYFAVNNGSNTTMNIVFSGSIDGKSQKMVANLTGIAPRQWRQVKFVKKVDEQGTATFSIEILDYVSDEELSAVLDIPMEPVLAPDPNAPKGDGGIKIEFAPDCTMFTDLENIVVPASSTPMDLRLLVTVPDGIKKLVVDMASTSASFISAVALAGGTTLDLINPKEAQDIVFQIVPFPHGNELAGQTSLVFDLSAAQIPILAFPGEHTFTMNVTDMNGCVNSIPVKLIVVEEA